MSQRRMFSLKVIDTDEFLDMPQTTQLLYYNLAMRADDDGFIGNPKKIMRISGCGDDDMKVLIAKRFVIPFENGICVIRHWRIHNLIRADRYCETEYLAEKEKLFLNKGKYEEKKNVIPNGNQVTPQVRLGKVRLGKVIGDVPQSGTAPLKKKKHDYDDQTPMDLKEFTVWCEKSPHKHIKLISSYAEEKEIDFKTKGQWNAFIDRNVKVARQLSPYSEEQLSEAMGRLYKRKDKNGGYITEWTLETLLKFLDHK